MDDAPVSVVHSEDVMGKMLLWGSPLPEFSLDRDVRLSMLSFRVVDRAKLTRLRVPSGLPPDADPRLTFCP